MSVQRVFISLEEAAEVLGVSVWTIRRRIADGSLPGYRIGGRSTIRVRVDDVIGLAERIPTGQGDDL